MLGGSVERNEHGGRRGGGYFPPCLWPDVSAEELRNSPRRSMTWSSEHRPRFCSPRPLAFSSPPVVERCGMKERRERRLRLRKGDGSPDGVVRRQEACRGKTTLEPGRQASRSLRSVVYSSTPNKYEASAERVEREYRFVIPKSRIPQVHSTLNTRV